LIRKRIKLIFLVTVAIIILSGVSIYTYLSVLDELNKCLMSTFKTLEISSVEVTDLTYNPPYVKFNISLMLKNSAGYEIIVKSIRGEVFVKVVQMVDADDYTMYINGTIVGYASYYFVTAERVEDFCILYRKS